MRPVVGCFGGDEFVVVLAGTSREDAHHVAGKLADDVLEARLHRSTPVSLSYGVAAFHGDASSGAALLRVADHALLAAKRHRGAEARQTADAHSASITPAGQRGDGRTHLG